MARILVTGSAEGLGYAAARQLQAEGHQVVLHLRNRQRVPAVAPLIAAGAMVVFGDLAHLEQTRALAGQVSALGPLDAVIHNAGVFEGPAILPVNVVAPYVLTALLPRPSRLIYLSSSMHLAGQSQLQGLDWHGEQVTASYSDSKLLLTTLAMAVARLWPEVSCHAVDPGWVPTRMGGPDATDDLELGHLTQSWLAGTPDLAALPSGSYWYHQQRQAPHPAALDQQFQQQLLAALQQATAVQLVT